MSELMRAARLHAVGEKMVIEDVERPAPPARMSWWR